MRRRDPSGYPPSLHVYSGEKNLSASPAVSSELCLQIEKDQGPPKQPGLLGGCIIGAPTDTDPTPAVPDMVPLVQQVSLACSLGTFPLPVVC